jgi:hypothetical protein
VSLMNPRIWTRNNRPTDYDVQYLQYSTSRNYCTTYTVVQEQEQEHNDKTNTC